MAMNASTPPHPAGPGAFVLSRLPVAAVRRTIAGRTRPGGPSRFPLAAPTTHHRVVESAELRAGSTGVAAARRSISEWRCWGVRSAKTSSTAWTRSWSRRRRTVAPSAVRSSRVERRLPGSVRRCPTTSCSATTNGPGSSALGDQGRRGRGGGQPAALRGARGRRPGGARGPGAGAAGLPGPGRPLVVGLAPRLTAPLTASAGRQR